MADRRINSDSVGLSCAFARWMARVKQRDGLARTALQLRQLRKLVIECQLFRIAAQPDAQPFLCLRMAIACRQALREIR